MAEHKPIDYTPQSAKIFRTREENEAEGEGQGEGAADDVRATTPEPDNERRVVRHSFDIYADQLQALHQIQGQRWQQSGKKPKMGTLIQEAIDQYILSQGEGD